MLGQSYMKVYETSWILGTGYIIVSLQVTCMRSHADASSKVPNSAREQKEIIRH